MRFVVLVALLAGCPKQTDDLATTMDPNAFADAGAGSVPFVPCRVDTDCALAGATCCACPTFPVAANDPALQACATVPCPLDPTCPTDIHAACRNQMCVVACQTTACPLNCGDGYAVDAMGCLQCSCSSANADSCSQNSDCAEVATDCCGCARGGADMALPVNEVAGYEQAMNCPTNPQCPDQNTCTPGAEPLCENGRCALDTPTPLPADACGRPDLAACPGGKVCTLNADPVADRYGVGVCR